METIPNADYYSIVTTENDPMTGDLIGWCRYDRETMNHLFDSYGWTKDA
jgi:hypothetical protein